jgi:carboxylesterase type B
MNYRLGVFGYLSTGDKNLPGNYGALDQVTALDWVQKNIAKFGGDPKSVTIFGHSAGAGAPHLLALSPRAKGKFHKVILQSGTAINSWVTDKHPSYYASDYAKRAGCPQKLSSTELVDCLKAKSTQELIDVQKDTIDYFLLPMWIQNVVDGHSRPSGQSFLPDHPEKLIDNKKYDESIPLMTGLTSAEGIMGYTFIHLAEGDKFLDADHFTTKIVPRMVSSLLPYGYEDEVERISAGVLKQYFPGGKDKLTEDDIVKGTIELQGDSLFNWGNRAILQKYAKLGHKKLYSYVISHKAKKSPSTVWAQLKEMKDKGFSISHPLIQTGVGHVDDMYFLFDPSEIFPSDPTYKWTPEDVKFADFMSSVWVSFAKTGSPAEGISKMNGYTEWKPVESGSVNYYNLTSVSTPMGRDFREKGSEFWNRVYKSLEGKIKENRKVDEL